ncbi:MAG: AbrB/MazE/SpoVT family DNA-binding domain-containing protein, partial [Oscillospiraceae bacterium]|nr:AbrB/MazE/SpoVT family DNA-binding domain-containing protein [Oscillospiraceae bacterium]
IVLPIELRRTLNLEIKDPVEIFTENDCVILKKFEPTCIFCGSSKEVTDFKGKTVCAGCLKELKGE